MDISEEKAQTIATRIKMIKLKYLINSWQILFTNLEDPSFRKEDKLQDFEIPN